MPALKKKKWERFAQEVAKGTANGKAYQVAYNLKNANSAAVAANRLIRNPNIVARIKELIGNIEKIEIKALQGAADELQIDKTWVLSKLKDNAIRCMQAISVLDEEGNPIGEYKWNPQGANKALELIGRHFGMFPTVIAGDKNNPLVVEHRSADELREAILSQIRELGLDEDLIERRSPKLIEGVVLPDKGDGNE